MSWPQGIDFRATSGYVSDPANCDYDVEINVSYPHTTAQGNSVGWEDTISSNTRNRSTSVDHRLSGIHFCANNIAKRYRVDLPAGRYNLYIALGDATSGQRQSCQVFDDTTLVATICTDVNTTTGQFVDATGTLRTSAAIWVSDNQPIAITISSGIFRIKLGTGTSGAVNSSIAHLFLEPIFTADTATITTITEINATETSEYVDAETVATVFEFFDDPTMYDADTINSVASIESVEEFAHNDAATVDGITSVSAIIIELINDAATIESKTTPDVPVELQTVTQITIGSAAYVGEPITATITIEVPGQVTGGGSTGGGTTVGGTPDVTDTGTTYTQVTGFWGPYDDDDGLIT